VWWLTPVIQVTMEAEIARIEGQGQPGQKIVKTPFQQINWVWWLVPVTSTTQEA
jgi:hypothetical protein